MMEALNGIAVQNPPQHLNLVPTRQGVGKSCMSFDSKFSTVKERHRAYYKNLLENAEDVRIHLISDKRNGICAEVVTTTRLFKAWNKISVKGTEDRFNFLRHLPNTKSVQIFQRKSTTQKVYGKEERNGCRHGVLVGLLTSGSAEISKQAPSIAERKGNSAAPMEKSRAWRAWQKLHFQQQPTPNQYPHTFLDDRIFLQKQQEAELDRGFCKSQTGKRPATKQEELAIHVENLRSALDSPATNNEILHREKEVHASITTMREDANTAQLEYSRSLRGWLEAGEAFLQNFPKEDRVLELMKCFDEAVQCHQLRFYQQNEQASIWSWRRWGFQSRDHRMRHILQASEQLESDLSRLSNLHELVQQMRCKSGEVERKLEREREASAEAVEKLREAVAKGEVAWLINAEESSSRVAKAVKGFQRCVQVEECVKE